MHDLETQYVLHYIAVGLIILFVVSIPVMIVFYIFHKRIFRFFTKERTFELRLLPLSFEHISKYGKPLKSNGPHLILWGGHSLGEFFFDPKRLDWMVKVVVFEQFELSLTPSEFDYVMLRLINIHLGRESRLDRLQPSWSKMETMLS